MSIEPLLNGLFDYAGMFPPAALSFDDALAETARFPETLRRPTLVANDIVLTPASLGELDEAALEKAGYAGRSCTICLVGVPASDAEAMAHAAATFNEERRHASVPQRITAIEIHAEELDDVPEALRAARKAAPGVALYFEPKWNDDIMAQRFTEATGMLHALRSDGAPIGFKVRCAGPTALSHEVLAAIIVDVNQRRIPLKLTQGLHHPFAGNASHQNEHGFLNVAIALRLQHALRWDAATVAECLADPDESSFSWGDGLGWRMHRALMQQVMTAIAAVPFAIGSCSIAEPDADLVAMQV